MMASVGYSAARRTLEIEFRSGDVYRYFGVPEKTFRALIASSSKGRFFQANIDGVYDFDRVVSRGSRSPRKQLTKSGVRDRRV